MFDTDCGKIAVLICYDSEFPELARLATFQGAQVLFVPFWYRHQKCLPTGPLLLTARAIENECFVAITGSVGNLPYAENMDIQYAQAAIFSPSDFSFPHDAILAEATPQYRNDVDSRCQPGFVKTGSYAPAPRVISPIDAQICIAWSGCRWFFIALKKHQFLSIKYTTSLFVEF